MIFHSKPFSEKTDNFLRNEISSILGVFWTLFAQIWSHGNFSKKLGLVSFYILQLSNNMPKVKKKPMTQFWQKPVTSKQTNRQTDGCKETQGLIHGLLPLLVWPKIVTKSCYTKGIQKWNFSAVVKIFHKGLYFHSWLNKLL